MHTEITSDTDQSKQSLSPKFTYHHGESSELSFCEDNTSPEGQRISKSYRKMRSASAPRAYVTETNIWREFSLPSYCVPDYRRTPAMYIEQDIINKQRQEIQLLMEELGNRDQELTDLVMSHQKQVKAWECDNEKTRALQAKLAYCEDELKSKEDQLKKVLVELASVNDQREVDVQELKRTQNEMIKLTERIMENSLYIKEMEAQNQKLNSSLRDFANMRQAFRVREQELVALLKEKDFRVTDRQQEVDKLADYVKILESQCRELGERNNNMTEESINWRKKYCILKEETERLNDDCKKKEENMQKMTQQLHESLQQAIALQKALFTSCEREKCKEEVMYSLRRQHKRTMQELQNIRELYDRLTRDTSLYHLSIRDKEFASEGKRKEEEAYEEDVKKKRHLDHTDKWQHDSRRKVNINMSFNKFKQLEDNEESFLLKESKERKALTREGKHRGVSEEDSAGNNTEEEGKNGTVSAHYNIATDRSKVQGTKDASQRMSPNATSNKLKNGHDSSKVALTNQTFSVEADYIKIPAVGFRNRSKNSESRAARSPCHSPLSDSSGISQRGNPVSLQQVVGDVSPKTEGVKEFKENAGVRDQPLSSSRTSWHDGMCSEVTVDKPQKDTSHRDPPAQPQGSSACELRPSRSTAGSRKDDLPKRDQEEQQFSTSDEPASVSRQPNKKKSVEFDMQDQVITSCGRQAQVESHCVCSESDCHVSQSDERNNVSAARSNSACLNKCQPSRQQVDVVCESLSSDSEERRKNSPLKTREDSLEECKSSDKECSQRIEKLQHCEHEGHENDPIPRVSENSLQKEVEAHLKMKPVEKYDLRPETCSHCRAKGRRVCDCSRSQRSCGAHCKQPTVTFAPEVSCSDKSYPSLKEPVTLTSKFSFVEMNSQMDYFSSLRESENSLVQEFSKREFNECPLTYPPVTELKNPLSHQPNKKIHFSLPLVDSFHNQNQHHKVLCADLPEEVSAYLARQRSFRPDMYYNNNNRSDHHPDPDMAADSSDFEPRPCIGQSLSRSGQSLSSCGQSARSVSNEKPQRSVGFSKEESVFLQDTEPEKDRQQKQARVMDDRRGKVLEVGREDVHDVHQRCDDNANRGEDCGKRLCGTVRRFDAHRRTFDDDCKRFDDFENKCANNKKFDSQRRSDDCQRRSEDSQRKSDDTQRKSDDTQRRPGDIQRRPVNSQRRPEDNTLRFDCENGCDNSANNSNRENAASCSQGSCCDVTALAREKTPVESKHGSSFLKKTQHTQEKRQEIRGEFQYEQTSHNVLGDSPGESYFCPEESDAEIEICADCQPRLPAGGEKAALVHGGACGQVSVRQAHLKSGADLLLHIGTSQHPSEKPQLVQIVLPKGDGDCSGAQKNKPGMIASLGQTESDSRSCEFEGRSDVTKSSEHPGSDNRSFELEARPGNPLSSRHRASDSTSCMLKGRPDLTTSSKHEGSDRRSFELEDRPINPSSSRHRAVSRRSCELEDRPNNPASSRHRAVNRRSCELEDRPNNLSSSRHRAVNRRSCELEGGSAVVLSSTQRKLQSRSFEEDGRCSFTLYSTQEQLDNELLQLDSKSDVTSADTGELDTSSSQPKDRSGVTISAVHKQSINGFYEQDHKTSEGNVDSKYNTSTISSCIVDHSHLGNCSHTSHDCSNGRIAAGNVWRRLYNCSHEVAH